MFGTLAVRLGAQWRCGCQLDCQCCGVKGRRCTSESGLRTLCEPITSISVEELAALLQVLAILDVPQAPQRLCGTWALRGRRTFDV
mmetsp:Transcript_1588/g.5105  ORF Transcript_1588/g.5105 Transcript_1588/m.5105 type:complete len:86 (-) Transcript_1588:32-289(-)|eukprot:scaffold169266_cov29-Tisochrysis_lutea.AAC.2